MDIVDRKYSFKKQGVSQGEVLPPTLFILFMNHLVPELPKGIQSALYLVLWCSEEYASTAKYRIQSFRWAKQWCVTINREKTTGTLFALSPKPESVKLILDDTPLKMEHQKTYLWVTFDKRMPCKQHITSADAKARRKLNIMRKLAGTTWGANGKILKSVYQGNVRPHLEYGSSSWMSDCSQVSSSDFKQSSESGTGAMKSTPIKKKTQKIQLYIRDKSITKKTPGNST
ncbi:Hypothetical predicted protein [Mytilus galloprovincialis]|uniref:Reverse transcriptase domain-containing protein n=1 Tax=Mytilus galloprovincialis TaxID=29158 RepID=A0A8B6FEI3_MYTGA|nr:Hypothetical predicted protein [Mytilus galloprovincialis]